jgi:hypothetical protein
MMNPILIAAGGYVLAFGMMLALLRFEYEMPRLTSAAFGGSVVALGFLIALTGEIAGLASFEQLSGLSGATMFLTALGVAVVD